MKLFEFARNGSFHWLKLRLKCVQRDIRGFNQPTRHLCAWIVLGLPLVASDIALARSLGQQGLTQAEEQNSVRSAMKKSTKPLRTIGLKCPEANSGILEVFRRNEDGITARLRYKVVNNEVERYIIEGSVPGKIFEVVDTWARDTPYTGEDKTKPNKELAQARPVWNEVCKNSDHGRNFENLMERNRKELAQFGDLQPVVLPRYFKIH